MRFGLIQVAAFEKDRAQAAFGLIISGVEADHILECLLRFRKAFQSEVKVAKFIPGAIVIRIYPHGFPKMRQRRRELLQIELRPAGAIA